MRNILLGLLLLISTGIHAQSGINRFQWIANPTIHTIPTEFREAAAVFVADQRFVEFAFEKEELFLYKTLHRVIHLNNDRGIESFNKIYIPFDDEMIMVDMKARTILPNGKVIEVDKKNIKDITDEDGQFKIFAVDGITPGSEVEYYYTVKRAPSFFGREILSANLPVMMAKFELVAPEHLVFEAMSFNGLASGKDTMLGEKRYITIQDNNLKGLSEEKYSMYQSNLKRVEYKLSYNIARSKSERLFTWNELSKRLHDIYNVSSDKENKKIKDLLDDINIKSASTDAAKIVAIENYMKKNFITKDDIPGSDADDLAKVIKLKMASERATIKLYLALFRAAGIDYQLVLAGDRNNYAVERSFENWNNAKNFLVYFPSTGKSLAPIATVYRYPWFPPTWAGTNGLYCISTTIGNFTTSIGEVKMIPLEAYEHNYLNMDMDLELDKNDELVIKVKQLYAGYAAPNYKIPFVYMPADQQDDVLKQMIKFGSNTENIISHSFENREMEQKDPYKPFVINASVKASSLVEHAGPKLIIKIGEVIGEQSQMYDAKERNTKIDLEFPHALVRTIRLKIPEGYKITNADDLNINIVHKENDVVTMGFVSGYKLNGNILTITVVEDYRNYDYPIEQYDTFKKVINAAADFNKVVLVLEKG